MQRVSQAGKHLLCRGTPPQLARGGLNRVQRLICGYRLGLESHFSVSATITDTAIQRDLRKSCGGLACH